MTPWYTAKPTKSVNLKAEYCWDIIEKPIAAPADHEASTVQIASINTIIEDYLATSLVGRIYNLIPSQPPSGATLPRGSGNAFPGGPFEALLGHHIDFVG